MLLPAQLRGIPDLVAELGEGGTELIDDVLDRGGVFHDVPPRMFLAVFTTGARRWRMRRAARGMLLAGRSQLLEFAPIVLE